MQYRNVGQWGIQVSSISLGSWLTYGGSVGNDTATRCVERAYDLGINFFDTANIYMKGAAEEVVGKALAPYARDSYVLATKVFFPMTELPNGRGLSRKHIMEQCHASLTRLNAKYVDLYQCHRFDESTPLEETCSAMNDLVRQGKTLYWGVSEWSGPRIREAVRICRDAGWAVPISNQPQYSALWRVIEDDVIPTSVELGLGQVVWSPLAMGVLSGKYHDVENPPSGSRAAGDDKWFMANFWRQETLDAVQQLVPLAHDAGCTLAQLALAWCLQRDAISSVIAGASRPDHVDENVVAADLEIDPEIFASMDNVLAEVQARPS
ncbi:MAG: aldo/keto reductase family protein [Acidimicrobiia bacterium]